MAIQGRQITLAYRAIRHGQLFDDDPALHTVMLVTNETPIVPQSQPERCGVTGHYIVRFGGHQTSNIDSLILVGTSATDGVLLEAIPSVHPVSLPQQKPGEPGGLLLGATKGAVAVLEDGSVVMGATAKKAIAKESFTADAIRIADGGIHERAFAKGALSPQHLSDDFAKWLLQALFQSDQPLNTKAGHVRIVNGTGVGELQMEKGVVQASTPADKGATLSEDSIKAVSAPLVEAWQKLQPVLTTASHIEALAKIVNESIAHKNGLEDLVAQFRAKYQAVASSVDTIYKILSEGIPAKVVDIAGDANAAQKLRAFLTEGTMLENSGIGGVNSVAKPVRLEKPVDANLVSVDGHEDIIEVLLTILDDEVPPVELNATITGQTAPATLSGETVKALVEALLAFTKEPLPPLSAAPPVNATIVDRIRFIYDLFRLPHHIENGKEELRSDNGKSTIAVRSTTEKGTHATGLWK